MLIQRFLMLLQARCDVCYMMATCVPLAQ